jgi:hypothetical protein
VSSWMGMGILRLVDVGDSWGALLGPPVCLALGWRRIMDTVAPCIS